MLIENYGEFAAEYRYQRALILLKNGLADEEKISKEKLLLADGYDEAITREVVRGVTVAKVFPGSADPRFFSLSIYGFITGRFRMRLGP